MTQQQFDEALNNSVEWQALAPSTQNVYLSWILRFSSYYHINRTPGMSPREKIMSFLADAYKDASVNTLKQGVSALSWFYTHIKKIPPEKITIQRSYHLPGRFTKKKISDELGKLPLLYEFMGWIFAGSGLLLSEAVGLSQQHIVRHPERYGEYLISDIGKTVPIPLCKEASRIYHILRRTDTKEERIFPKTPTQFCKMCRKYNVERDITPGSLRANFILLSIEKNGVAWAQAATGLSNVRMKQYLDMLPSWKRMRPEEQQTNRNAGQGA